MEEVRRGCLIEYERSSNNCYLLLAGSETGTARFAECSERKLTDWGFVLLRWCDRSSETAREAESYIHRTEGADQRTPS